jgi:hypothetical protein
MFRTTTLEVSLRQRELLREAANRRLASTVRRPDRRPSRIALALGLSTAPAL